MKSVMNLTAWKWDQSDCTRASIMPSWSITSDSACFLMSHKCEISSGDSSFLQPANYFPHMFQKILSHEKKNNFNQIIQNITNNMKRRNMNNQRNHQSGYFWSKNVLKNVHFMNTYESYIMTKNRSDTRPTNQSSTRFLSIGILQHISVESFTIMMD